ncbi:hypothetical protein GCM10011274_26300 [Paraglaciecola chathamensis]|uniref:Uncharacterized protein n=1 Tax=Paraglaciecola chathamensis TaxID=368405 RepID=A0A8H9IH64_9ALTE|nr:hypothetical protein GCM10011274_26300 [Paraglaciecola oceanifecundans]
MSFSDTSTNSPFLNAVALKGSTLVLIRDCVITIFLVKLVSGDFEINNKDVGEVIKLIKIDY